MLENSNSFIIAIIIIGTNNIKLYSFADILKTSKNKFCINHGIPINIILIIVDTIIPFIYIQVKLRFLSLQDNLLNNDSVSG